MADAPDPRMIHVRKLGQSSLLVNEGEVKLPVNFHWQPVAAELWDPLAGTMQPQPAAIRDRTHAQPSALATTAVRDPAVDPNSARKPYRCRPSR